jgi:hypothetical protein
VSVSQREAGVRAVAVGLLLEEQRGEIVSGWREHVERELGGDPALAFAVGPLLREMSLALRGDGSPFRPAEVTPVDAGGARSAVLVRSGAASGRVAREFKLLHRAIWDALKRAGAIVGVEERRAADEWLDEALAAALDRQDRLRTRADLLDASPVSVGTHAHRPAVEPWEPDVQPVSKPVSKPEPAAPSRRPPPLPARAAPHASVATSVPPVVAPARPPPLPRPASRPHVAVAETSFSALE